jgi:hypothetical protein
MDVEHSPNIIMNKTDLLLSRLNEIGESLSKKRTALALIGLGSVGLELDRLDQFSDLDFFVVVKNGCKSEYLQNLAWLSDISPIAYYFANTLDGYKLLYEDGVFCEFAVFEIAELEKAAFAPGRVAWKAQGVSESIGIPKKLSKGIQRQSTEWLIGEALTNLYVGLSRDHRGEKLSAMKFIQGYAVERILELSEQMEKATTTQQDIFNLDRGYEFRYPGIAQLLPTFLQGYGRNRESSLAILSFLDNNFDINTAMKLAVLRLCKHDLKLKGK